MSAPGRRVGSSWFTIALSLLALGPGTAAGQAFGFRLERGELGVDGRGLYQAAGVSPGASSSDYQQWLRLPVSGHLVHPRVLRYTLAFRPLFGQHIASIEGQASNKRSLGLDASATAFSARRMTLTFQANRSSGTTRADLGAQSEFENEGFTTLLFVRDRYFPTTVSYSDRRVRDTWRSPFVLDPIERDQRSSRLRAEVRNRRLTTILEQTSYRDLRGTSDHDARSAQARHRIAWGKGSSLNSTLNLYRRVGSSAIDRTSWSERALIAHTSAFSTAYAYSLQSWARAAMGGKNRNYDITARYSPGIALDAALSLNGQQFVGNQEGDGVTRFRIAPSARYLLNLPSDTKLHLSGSVGRERLSRTLPSDLPLDVLEEPHEVTEERTFVLDQLRVDPLSIEIWTEDRTLLLAEGVDYRIIDAGGLTEIQVLPGARVSPGETVLVTYRFRTVAVESTALTYVNYETTLRRGGLSLRHGRRQRSEEVTGASGTLDHPDDVDLWYGVTYSGRTRLGGLTLEALRRSRDASEIEYSSDELRAEITPRRWRTVESRLRASTARTIAGEQVTRTTSFGASASWPATRRIQVNGGVDGWIWGRAGQSSERFLSGHVMVSWRFGEMNALMTFDQIRRANGISRTENRWSVRVVRRF